jgi:hypothetical protein
LRKLRGKIPESPEFGLEVLFLARRRQGQYLLGALGLGEWPGGGKVGNFDFCPIVIYNIYNFVIDAHDGHLLEVKAASETAFSEAFLVVWL